MHLMPLLIMNTASVNVTSLLRGPNGIMQHYRGGLYNLTIARLQCRPIIFSQRRSGDYLPLKQKLLRGNRC
jgi:hypothetical protein